MLTRVKDSGWRMIRAKEAQRVASDCQTQGDFRAERSKKIGWGRQHHHDLSPGQEHGEYLSGLEGVRRRKKG